MSGLKSQALAPFGFEVELASVNNIDAATAEEMRALYQQEGLLVMRGLELSHPEQTELHRHLGPVSESANESFIISNVEAGGYLGQREIGWHNDVPFLPAPYLGAALHALRVDSDVVSTRFASGYRAYERLPQQLKERIENLKTLQVRERVYDRANRLTDLLDGDICTVHNIVRANPVTGRKYLFLNQAWTDQVIGLPESEGLALLEELFGYFYAEDNVYEHKWTKGDLVIWDNLALNHARGAATHGVRTLQRTTLAEFGYADQYPTDLKIAEELHNAAMLEGVDA